MAIACNGEGQITLTSIVEGVNLNETNLTNHEADKANPHAVTSEQVGLGSLSNRNILIDGEVGRINQSGFDGSSWVNGEYGYDIWKATATQMTQIVEVGNFKTNSEYTLSGNGITTQQITSPSSGDWTIPEVPRTATNIQLELGSSETEFEILPYSDQLTRVQRYYELFGSGGVGAGSGAADMSEMLFTFNTEKRTNPTMLIKNNFTVNVLGTANYTVIGVESLYGGLSGVCTRLHGFTGTFNSTLLYHSYGDSLIADSRL